VPCRHGADTRPAQYRRARVSTTRARQVGRDHRHRAFASVSRSGQSVSAMRSRNRVLTPIVSNPFLTFNTSHHARARWSAIEFSSASARDGIDNQAVKNSRCRRSKLIQIVGPEQEPVSGMRSRYPAAALPAAKITAASIDARADVRAGVLAKVGRVARKRGAGQPHGPQLKVCAIPREALPWSIHKPVRPLCRCRRP